MTRQTIPLPAKSAEAAPPPTKRYVTLDEAAEYLSCSTLTVRRRIAAGELSGYRVGKSRTIRVRLDEVEAMLRPIPTGGGFVG